MKIVGINPIMTKKGKAGILLSTLSDYGARNEKAVGQLAETTFVAREVFDAAVGGIPLESVVGMEGRVLYDRNGFVDGLQVQKQK